MFSRENSGYDEHRQISVINIITPFYPKELKNWILVDKFNCNVKISFRAALFAIISFIQL